MDRQTTDAWLYFELTYEHKGSSELKIKGSHPRSMIHISVHNRNLQMQNFKGTEEKFYNTAGIFDSSDRKYS